MASDKVIPTAEATPSPKRDRSPNYPAVRYTKAEDCAFRIWNEDKQHAVNKDVASKHMGYAKSSGATLPLFAAMKRYGLAEPVGTELRITDDAHFMFLHPPGSAERTAMRKKLAMKPELFAEVMQKYGPSLPSDATLKAKLRYDFKFASDEAAETFIEALREAIAIADEPGVATADQGADNNGHPIKEPPVTNPHDSAIRPAMTPAMSTSGPRPQSSASPLPPTPAGQTRSWNLGGGVAMTVILPNPSELRKSHIERIKKFVAALEHEASVTWEDEEEAIS